MNDKIEVIACEIETLVSKIEEKQYAPKVEELINLLKEEEDVKFNQVSITECHVISCIANMKEANGINIARELKMTRGGISKIANRLMEKGLIIAYQDGENQKKIFYSLTPLGRKVHQIHMKLHQQNHHRLCQLMQKYSSEEQDVILKFIKDLQMNNDVIGE